MNKRSDESKALIQGEDEDEANGNDDEKSRLSSPATVEDDDSGKEIEAKTPQPVRIF